MKLSYKWLGEYVDLSGITPEMLAEKMTTAGKGHIFIRRRHVLVKRHIRSSVVLLTAVRV